MSGVGCRVYSARAEPREAARYVEHVSFGVWSLGFGVWGVVFGVEGLACSVEGLGLRVEG